MGQPTGNRQDLVHVGAVEAAALDVDEAALLQLGEVALYRPHGAVHVLGGAFLGGPAEIFLPGVREQHAVRNLGGGADRRVGKDDVWNLREPFQPAKTFVVKDDGRFLEGLGGQMIDGYERLLSASRSASLRSRRMRRVLFGRSPGR